MNTFGEFLFSLRKEKGMTQAELAEKLGVSNKAVSKWETNEAMPETGLLVPISRIFGVTVDELLNGCRTDISNENGKEETNKFVIEDYLFKRGKNDGETKMIDRIGGAVCAFIMFVSLAAYFVLGAWKNLWHPYWVIIPVGALSCGIAGIIFDLFNKEKRRKKYEKGENPFIGAICGTLMLISLITYLILGAIFSLWHPYWVIIVFDGVLCGFTGIVGEIIVYFRKNK